MSYDPDERSEHTFDRRFKLCQRLPYRGFSENIRTCPNCGLFFAACCQHLKEDERFRKICHHWPLVFTDGACFNNGRTRAQGGLGVAMGEEANFQFSLPVSDLVDISELKRTSQRAELLGALEGLDRLSASKHPCYVPSTLRHGQRRDSRATGTKNWIIAMDSEYVVKGITEWLPKWKENGLRTAQGATPSNLDLFLRLDEAIAAHEASSNVCIGFWHVPREFNTFADALAKRGAQADQPAL